MTKKFGFLCCLVSCVFNTSIALAFSCVEDNSLEARFGRAERVMLLQITDTRREDKLARELQPNTAPDDFLNLQSSGYKVLENFKGNPAEEPRLLDIMGIGTGFVNFTPGYYNLVFMGPKPATLNVDYRSVSLCDVVHHRHLDDPHLQKAISTVRKLRDKNP